MILDRLNRLIKPQVDALGYDFWGCVFSSARFKTHARSKVLRVYIDHANGIKLIDCERVNRHLNHVLDVEDPIFEAYSLEVSSPGINRPLFTPEQFSRFLQNRIFIRARCEINHQRNFKGILNKVTEMGVVLMLEDQEITLNWNDVARANVCIYD